MDCEFIEDGGNFVRDFIDKFIEDVKFIRREKLSSTKHAKHHQYHEDMNLKDINKELLTMKSNVKLIPLKKLQNIPEDLHALMNMKKLKKNCNQLHRQIRSRHKNMHEKEEEEEDLNAESENMRR